MSVCALRVDSIDGRCIQLKWSSSTGRDCKPVARMSSFISSFRLLLFFFLLRLLPSPLLCPAFFVLFYFSPLLFSLSLSLSYNVYTLDSFGILPLLPFVFLLATRGRDARGPTLVLRTFTNCTSLATTSRSSSDNSK